MGEDTVVLLTTWNRPTLLAQSLPGILDECDRYNYDLVIADDQSDDDETLKLLRRAEDREAWIVRRNYVRKVSDSPHELTQLNAIFAFKYLFEEYPDVKYIIKLDDDIFLTPGTFDAMREAWAELERDGEDVLGISGIATTNEPVIQEHTDWYAETSGICHACVMYRPAELKLFFSEIPKGNIIVQGWDDGLYRLHKRKYRQLSKTFSLVPSWVAHTGYTGTHTLGDDFNVNFKDSLEGIIMR